ncbi:MAG: RnfABCDGE type electron transport complex subunit D [Williamsia sp.]|nr:RnfABCDGE type electron transport complex subunit D [Williamsia sp.]
MKNNDLRLAALIRFATAITVLNIFGHFVLGFETSLAHACVALLTAYTLEITFETISARIQHRKPGYAGGFQNWFYFLLPGHISAMAVSMLMFTNQNLLPIVFATSLAVLSKVIFKVKIGGKVRHFLNPSNTGIAVSFILFPWVSTAPPYQFTENVAGWWDWVLPVIFISAGSFLNLKFTRKGPLIAAWLCGFFAQAVLRSLLFGVSMAPALLPMTGVAFLLYTFYMISDPSTTPMKTKNQIAFGLSVAAVYGVLMTMHISFGLFFSLIIVCTTRGTYFGIMNMIEEFKSKQKAAVEFPVIPEPRVVPQMVYEKKPATLPAEVLQD